LLRERLTRRNQVIPGIETRRDFDLLAKRLEVAQEGGAGERVDLAAGVVDVVLARHLVAAIGHERSDRIAEHRATCMAHMHRAGGVSRDVFYVDPLAIADVRAAELPAL